MAEATTTPTNTATTTAPDSNRDNLSQVADDPYAAFDKAANPATTSEPQKQDPTPAPESKPAESTPNQQDKPADGQDANANAENAAQWEKLVSGMVEQSGADGEIVKSFAAMCKEKGISPEHAQMVAEWQWDVFQKTQAAYIENGVKQLQQDWGRDASKNQQAVASLIATIDRELGNDSFSKVLQFTGAANHADFLKGLYKISTLLAEDATGKNTGASMPDAEETAEQFFARKFGKK